MRKEEAVDGMTRGGAQQTPRGGTCSIGLTWTQQAQHKTRGRSRERALFMRPRVRCCCRSSPAEPRPRNGSKRAGPAAGSGQRDKALVPDGSNKQRRSRDNSPKRASRAPSPHAGRRAGRQAGGRQRRRRRRRAGPYDSKCVAGGCWVPWHRRTGERKNAAHSPGGLPGWDASQFLVIPKHSSNACATPAHRPAGPRSSAAAAPSPDVVRK